MRDIDAVSLSALNGSRPGDYFTVWVWYAGQLALQVPLDVSNCEVSWDTTRQVQTFDCDVADPSGKLVPRLFNDILGVGGSQLQVIYTVGGASTVNIGWFRITNPKPAENWRTYIIDDLGNVNPGSSIPPGKKLAWVSGGASIHLSCQDLAGDIGRNKLEAPDSPQGASPTILSEIARLVGDICPVVATATVVDRSVNKTLIYKDDRLNAVQDLCKRIQCDYRMNGDGQLEVYPTVLTAPVWTLRGGPDGVVVSVDWEQNIDGLYNVFIAEGTGTDPHGNQYPLLGRASITDGPMAEGGEFGTAQDTYSSTMLTTQAECDAYAITMRDTFVAGLTVLLNVTCAPNPALQQGETVLVGSPVVDGQAVDLLGNVQTMDLKTNGNTVDAMTLTVACPYATVATVFGSVDRG